MGGPPVQPCSVVSTQDRTLASFVVELADSAPSGPSAGRVVVGTEGLRDPSAVLDFAFRAADRRGVGLTAVLAGTHKGTARDAPEVVGALGRCAAAWPDVDVDRLSPTPRPVQRWWRSRTGPRWSFWECRPGAACAARSASRRKPSSARSGARSPSAGRPIRSWRSTRKCPRDPVDPGGAAVRRGRGATRMTSRSQLAKPTMGDVTGVPPEEP